MIAFILLTFVALHLQSEVKLASAFRISINERMVKLGIKSTKLLDSKASELAADKRIRLIESPYQGPGHTSEVPTSYWKNSRMELANIVIAAAIAYVAWQIKSKETWLQLRKYIPALSVFDEKNTLNIISLEDVENDASLLMSSTNFKQIPNSKIIVETIGEGDTPLQNGESVLLNIKVYYNGIPLKEFNGGNSLISWKYNQNYKLFDKLSLSGLKRDGILNQMKLNGRIRVLLPPEEAFGSVGLPPYLPGDSKVIVDIILTKSKKRI